MGARRTACLDITSYGGITHIRCRVEAHASSQPVSAPLFCRLYYDTACGNLSSGMLNEDGLSLKKATAALPAPPVRRSGF